MKAPIGFSGLRILLPSFVAMVFGLASLQVSAGMMTFADYDNPYAYLNSDGGPNSAEGWLSVIDDINAPSFTASEYGSGNGTFIDNLGFTPGTATGAELSVWLHGVPCEPNGGPGIAIGCQDGELYGAGIVLIDLDYGNGLVVAGSDPLLYDFGSSVLGGTLLAGIDLTGALYWQASILQGAAVVDGVGLKVHAEVPYEPKPVSEPSIIALFAVGLLGLGFIRRRKYQS